MTAGKPPPRVAAGTEASVKGRSGNTRLIPRQQFPLKQIRVGKRHRRDLGDIAGLAASMGELGLLHPVVVRPDGMLIAGERRLRAAEQLGWSTIPVTVVDLNQVARGEFAENAVRKDFTLSEAVAIKRALEPCERAAAKERQRIGGKLKASANLAEAAKGEARDKIASFTGIKRTTLARAEAIVAAAEAEPEKYGPLLAAMDKTGRVNHPYKRLRVAQQAARIRAEPPPLPGRGPYRVAVVDVPWPYEIAHPDQSPRGMWPYPTMSVDQMCAMPVASIMHEDSVLWFWTTNFHLVQGEATRVLLAWGFRPVTLLTWAKDSGIGGTGDWLRGKTEHAIMAVRGKPTVTLVSQSTLLHAPLRAHSQKPIEFYDFVESLCPAPHYADIFSRYQHNDKWDCHGDEAPQ
jgi:N6-adenosine-specific RNA methylase IME4